MPEYLKCSAKEKGQYGNIIIGVKAEDLIAFAKQHANERGYVNLKISKRREVGTYGDTHTVALDEFVPNASR